MFKKKKLILILTSLIILLSYGFSTSLISDNFENAGTLNPAWIVRTGVLSESNATARYGSYSMLLENTPQSGAYRKFDVNIYKKTVSVSGFAKLMSNGWTLVRLVDDNNKAIAGIGLTNDQSSYYTGTTVQTGDVGLDTGKWFFYSMIYNATTKKANYYFYDENKTLLNSFTNKDYYSPDSSNGSYPFALELVNSDLSDSYWDDVNVSYSDIRTIILNIYKKDESTHLTEISIDCNDNTLDATGQTSPITITNELNNFVDCNFTKTGFDQNHQIFKFDSDKTQTVYLTDNNAPTTTLSGCDGNWSNLNKTITLNSIDTETSVALTQYKLDLGTWQTYSAPFDITTDGNHRIDYNSTDIIGNVEATKTNYCPIDKTVPTMDFNITTPTNMLDNNIRIQLTCYDNLSSILNYKLDKYIDAAITNIYDVNDTNMVKKDINYTILDAKQFFRATCTDLAGNAKILDSNTIYSAIFNLINESNGQAITATDLNVLVIKKVYTTSGNFEIDLNVTPLTTMTFIGLTQPLIFEFSYTTTNVPTITRYIDIPSIPDLNVNDLNIGICVPVSPPLVANNFAEQRLVSNQQIIVTVKNSVSNCYDLIGSLSYAYDVGFAQTFYTVNKPYYLYFYSSGVKTFLSLLDGSQAQSLNLDTIIFSRQVSDFGITLDGVAINPLANPITHRYDTETVQIYYKNDYNNNTSLLMQIYADNTIVWSHNETASPNNVLVNFYWGAIPGLSFDSNNLRLVLTKTTSTGTTTSITYFSLWQGVISSPITISASTPEKKQIFLAIASLLVFFFGITIVAANRVFGFFGIIICVVALIICAYAYQVWYIQLLEAVYLIVLLYLILLGKQGQQFFYGGAT